MTILQERQFPHLMEQLKLALKAQGLRNRDIAQRLGVSLATVKRWLTSDGINTRHLEDLCNLAKIDLLELLASSGKNAPGKIDQFTPSQERALGDDARLFFVFFSLLNGLSAEECRRELQLSAGSMDRILKQLSRLALIDVISSNHVRILTTRNVSWRKDGPLGKYSKPQLSFVDVRTGAEGALYMTHFVRLTEAGKAQVRYLMEELREEISRIARADRLDDTHARTWYGALFFVRPLDMNAIRASMAKTP